MKKKVLVFGQVNKNMLEKAFPALSFSYRGYMEDFIVWEPEKICEVVSDYDILITEFETVNRAVLDAATNLKLIICCRGGVDTVVDLKYAAEKGITVKNTPGRNSAAVAEYVIGQIISIDRKFSIINSRIQNEELQSQQYIKPSDYRDSLWGMDERSPYHVFRGRGLQNLKLGIIGYGKVGKVLYEKASALGMDILIYDHSIDEVEPERHFVSLDSLLRESDIVSVHCSNKQHKVMFSTKEFQSMKNSAWFINTARGDLVDEDALVAAIKNKDIQYAVLDVTKEEPLPVGSKLVGVDNLIITPHIAGATDVVIDNVTRMTISYINEYLERENVVD